MARWICFFLLISTHAFAADLAHWPLEGKITDPAVLTQMAQDSRFELSQCPQLQALRGTIVPDQAPHDFVVFCIQNGSSGHPWNKQDLKLSKGQVLRILNFDEGATHRLHAGGAPCKHEPNDMPALKRDAAGNVAELSYYDCPVGVDQMDPLDQYYQARLYDHEDGADVAPFYVRVGEKEYYPGVPSKYSYDYVLDRVPLDQELTMARLVNAITVNELNTIESVAAYLPAEMKRWNYVTMYESRSLQDASPLAPRLITYSPTGRFVAAFNGGDPESKGNNTIEMIQFDDQKSRFDFYELQFRPQYGPILSAANPAKCMACHQSHDRSLADARPNWEPYDTWPGAYGSHSLVEGSFATPQEQRNYEAYEVAAYKNPRYDAFHPGPSLKAPTRLTEAFGELNFLRVSRLILEQSAIYEKDKELIWYFFQCNPGDQEMLSGPLKAPFAKMLASGNPYAQSDYTHVTTSFFLGLLFESEGVDTSDWSMDFHSRGGFSSIPNERFGTPLFTDQAFFEAFKYTLAHQKPQDLAQLQSLSCTDLKKRVEP